MGKFHFLSVGCADTTIIKSSNSTILIDCCSDIESHKDLLPSNKKLKAVFITHQHYDHFKGLQYLIDQNYDIEFFIYSPYERRYSDNSVEYDEWVSFNNLKDKIEKKGAKIYTPYRQDKFDNPWWSIDDLKIYMLGPEKNIAKEEKRELHDASLVFLVEANNKKVTFTGDASDKLLNWIANNTTNYCNDILHASHHGSINGADLDFIKNANIKDTIISTKSGVYSSVPDSTALQRYRSYTKNEVYRTDTSGSLSLDY